MKLLKKLYQISSPSRQEENMLLFIKSILVGANISYSTDKSGNIYAVKGKAKTYPCVVCHVDEVHKVRDNGYTVVETDGVIYGLNKSTMSYEGIGADDKNGIWVCLKALSEFDVLKCAFFVSEEIGCIGSSDADMKFFKDCRFVLQCDRKGSSDFITVASGTELCSDEFVKDANISNFGYKKANGMMTDVMTLKENGLKVSACNISCGYYNPHTNNEMTRFSDLLNCYELVKNIISTCTKKYPHKYVKPKYKPYNGYSKSLYFDDYWDDYKHDKVLDNLKSLLGWNVFKYKDVYKKWDYKSKKYVEVTPEELAYAENIDNYRYLLSEYDEVKFDKDGNPLVRNMGEKEFYTPIDSSTSDDKVLQQYDDMVIHMSDMASFDPESFDLDTYINIYGERFPLLKRNHYDMACEDVVGCLM